MRVRERLSRLDALVLGRLARGLHRIRRSAGRPSPLVISAVVLVAAVIAVATWRTNHPFAASTGANASVRVGVRDGDLISQYAAASRAELDELAVSGAPGEVYALVSLAMYLAPGRLATIVNDARAGAAAAHSGDLTTIAAYARVPLPRRQTQIVRLAAQRLPDDVADSMAKVANQKITEATEYSQRATNEPGLQLRAIYESNATLAAAEAQAYRLECACVYALVVRATPAALRVLAAYKEIRIIDAAPEVLDLRTAVFVAPFPDQVGTVTPPLDDGFPPAPAR